MALTPEARERSALVRAGLRVRRAPAVEGRRRPSSPRRLVTKAFTASAASSGSATRIRDDRWSSSTIAIARAGSSRRFAFPLPYHGVAELPRHRVGPGAVEMIVTPRCSRLTPELGDALARAHRASVATTSAFLASRRRPRRLRSGAGRGRWRPSLRERADSMVVLLIVAGHETTVSLIAHAVLEHALGSRATRAPRADPSLMPSAVRSFPSRHRQPRRADDHEVGREAVSAARRSHAATSCRGRRLGEPRCRPVPRSRHARLPTPGRGQARRLRTSAALLPRSAARTPRDGDRAPDAARASAEPPAGDRGAMTLLEADPDLPQPGLASSGVGSLDRSDGQRQPVDRTHDDSRPRVAPVLAARAPDLTVHLDLTDGP